ncbi:long-chain-fatty-acid--CoA ligase ACSBG2-like isoform X2 [Dysidea avara]
MGTWHHWTYDKYYNNCQTVAKAFIELGLEPQHGVCLLGYNSPEWLMSHMAAMMAGGQSVGIYLTSNPDVCQFIAGDCQANIIVVENDYQIHKILTCRHNLPHLKVIINCSADGTKSEQNVMDWKAVMQLGARQSSEKLYERMKLNKPNTCCSVIYTSGTTGTPKGVMISHDNVTWMCNRVIQYTKASMGAEHFVSYLPLSHIASQLIDIYVPLSSAGTVWFAQPDAMKGSLIQTMKEVRPTIFLGVPRVWEKIAEGMQLVANSLTGLKARISSWAKTVGLKGNHNKMAGKGTPFGWGVANYLYFKRIKTALGLDRCHFPMTGAAPISEETLSYFLSVNIVLHEMYGMTETTGPTTISVERAMRYRAAGKEPSGVKLRINNPDVSGQGEVLIFGRHVFMGYLRNPEKTASEFTEDGWLKSGDLGFIDADRYLFITGRLKELIITAGGENIPPVPIENAVKEQLHIVSNAMVVGDQMKYLSCLLTLKTVTDDKSGLPTDQLSESAIVECRLAGSSATTVTEIVQDRGDANVLKLIKKGIDEANKKAIAKPHKIVKWVILEKDFSIAGGELTPTLKLKRPVVMKKHKELIESLY